MFRSNVSVAVISIKTKKVINVTNLTAAVFSRITPALHLINYIVFDRTELEKSRFFKPVMEKVNLEQDLQEEGQFVVDDVSKIIKDAIETVIGGNGYQQSKVNNWTTAVVECCTSELTKLLKPYKYIVTCTIMQKNGAGLHTASSCYWDNNTDGSCTVRWENKTMFCIVSVYGLAI